VVMTHGDDDGLRLPPVIAPRQICLVPILRDKPEDAGVLEYCEQLARELGAGSAFGEPIRVLVDRKFGRAVDKRWGWVKRGMPLIAEIGARDVAAGAVTLIRRDRLRQGERIRSETRPRAELVRDAGALLAEVQSGLLEEARARLAASVRADLTSIEALQAYFGDAEDAEGFRGWALVPWAHPEGAALTAVERQLKALKITIRVAPLDQASVAGRACIFTGEPARELVLLGRAY